MKPNTLFVYGILKKGYELDLADYGASLIGEAHIPGAVLYGIGRNWHHESHPNDGREFHGVGLKLVDPRVAKADIPLLSGSVAHGELWRIPEKLWDWLDGIEQNGFCYTRKVVPARLDAMPAWAPYDSEVYKTVNSWVYEYTHPNMKWENPIESGRF